MKFKTKEKLAKKLLAALIEPTDDNIAIMRFIIYAICSIIGLENLELYVNEWIDLEEQHDPKDKIIQ